MISKTCKTCGETKPLAEFYTSKSHTDGYETTCKACYRARSAAYYQNNRERAMARQGEYYENNKPRILARDREYRQAHRDERRAYDAQYAKDHPEQVRAYKQRYKEANQDKTRTYYQDNRDRILDHVKAYSRGVAERIRERVREWARQNPERRRMNARMVTHRRRARKAGLTAHYTEQEWLDLCAEYGYICLACGQKRPLTADHIVPLSKGGSDDITNIQCLCGPCNSRKGSQTIDYRP